MISVQGTLLGTVTRALASSSFVRLVMDSRSSVAGQVLGSTADGIVKGDGRDLSFSLVEGDVNVGDAIVTSGLGGTYPPDLRIGEVSEVLGDPQDPFPRVRIDPTVRISTTRTVLVITSFVPDRFQLGQLVRAALIAFALLLTALAQVTVAPLFPVSGAVVELPLIVLLLLAVFVGPTAVMFGLPVLALCLSFAANIELSGCCSPTCPSSRSPAGSSVRGPSSSTATCRPFRLRWPWASGACAPRNRGDGVRRRSRDRPRRHGCDPPGNALGWGFTLLRVPRLPLSRMGSTLYGIAAGWILSP